MSKLRIAIDADNTLNNHMDRCIEMYNSMYGESIVKDDFVEYDIGKCMSFDDAEKFKQLFFNQSLWESLSPIDDAQWGVKKLIDDGYEVYVTTATHYTNFLWKVEWFKKYFSFIDSRNIICINDKSLLDVDFIVDDCLEQLINTKWAHRIVFDQPWNKNVWDDARILHRVYNWVETVDTIEAISKEEDC